MSGSTNSTDREPRTRDPEVLKEVFGPEDLPPLVLAPDGNMRVNLKLGVHYEIHSTFLLPLIWWPETPTAFQTFTEISGVSQNALLLMAPPPGVAQFWGRGVGNARLNNLGIFSIGGTTTVFDFVGQSTDIDPFQLQNSLFILNAGILAEDMGRVIDMGVNVDRSGWIANRGMVVRSVSGNNSQLVDTIAYLTAGVPMETPMMCYQGLQTASNISSGVLQLGLTDVSFCVDSGATGVFDFIGLGYGDQASSGFFFQPPISKSITKFDPADILFASVSDSIAKPGVDSTVHFSTIKDFLRGDGIILDGVIGTYDGPHQIVRVSADQKSFDINFVFAGTDSGAVKFTRVTSVGNGLVEGQTHTISGTTNYNDTRVVHRRLDADTFDIAAPFLGDDATGTVSATSKNQKSIGVKTTACGQQPDSKSVGGFHSVNNAVTTALPADTWTDIDFGTAVESSNIERWRLINTVTGELEHLGLAPFSGSITARMSCSKGAPPRLMQFRAIVNGLPTADGIISEASMGLMGLNEVVSVSLLAPVEGATNTTVRIQALSVGAASTLLVSQASARIGATT